MTSADPSIRRAYARDASGLELVPDTVARPGAAEEVVELLRRATAEHTPVTVAGGQTSTTGASITDRGMLLSLRALDHIGSVDADARTVRVQPGVIVGALKRALAGQGWLFAPDPTSEDEATIGGAIACNASGARSLRYGPTRPHVVSLRVALANGTVIDVRRSRVEKNTVGYALVHDPVDWFVGSEGTLGVVLDAELALLPMPPRVVGLGFPFAREGDALEFILAARGSRQVAPRCLELFDAGALALVREFQTREARAPWASGAEAFVYAEESGADDAEPPLDAWLALAEQHAARTDDVLVFESDAAIRDARQARHAVPATMIERGNANRPRGGRRVSTDWAVPYPRLREAIAEGRRLAREAGIEPPVIYGHAGNGHPHQNFIARDAAELERIERVVEATLRHVIALGGTVAAEHGVGKLKRRWVPLQLSPVQLGVMRAVKHELDPHGLLGAGNIF